MEDARGLRDRKKQRTRAAIAEVAMRLFEREGFDRVTVARIAASAEVSEKTVYNYYPRKGDLFFDESDAILAALLRTIRERAAGEPALVAVRRFLSDGFGRIGSARPPGPASRFRRLVEESAMLRSAQREMFARFETALATALAGETGAEPGAVEPFVAAVALVGVFRARFEQRPTGTDPAALQVELARRTGHALDLLERGLGDYAVAPGGGDLTDHRE